MDLTVILTAALAGGTFLIVVVFFAIIFLQEIQEFKDNPLPTTTTKTKSQKPQANDPEVGSISMSPLAKPQIETRKSSVGVCAPKAKARTMGKDEIILTPANLAIDSSMMDMALAQQHGITNEGFHESEVI